MRILEGSIWGLSGRERSDGEVALKAICVEGAGAGLF